MTTQAERLKASNQLARPDDRWIRLKLPRSVGDALFTATYHTRGTAYRPYKIADFLRESVDPIDLSWMPRLVDDE